MIQRKTTEQYNGYEVYLIGETASTLVKHYLKDDEMIPVPLTPEQLLAECSYTYTNKEGKTTSKQVGELKLIGVLPNGKVITRGKYTQGAIKTVHEVVAIHDNKPGRYASVKFPIDLVGDIAFLLAQVE